MTNVYLQRVSVRAFSALLSACVGAALLSTAALGATQEDKAEFSVKAGALTFSTAPAMPTLKEVTLNGGGQSGTEKSAVFAQYCPTATCGADTKGYVPSGATLPANSLTLNSTGASFSAQSGSTGTAPTLQCAASCNVDSASAVKIASAAVKAGEGTWLTTGFSATSLALATPSTLQALSNGEIYRANLLWTLSTGP
jgi:hypothetical protein